MIIGSKNQRKKNKINVQKKIFLIRVYNKPCGMQIISIVELREVRDQLKKASELERIRNVNIALL